MRRLTPLTLVVLLATTATGAALALPGAAQRMQVTEDEWFVNLSRARLKPGKAIIEVVNFGQDAHNLVIKRNAAGAKAVTVPKLDHFMRDEVTVQLTAGKYTLWCSLPKHRQRGMWATLSVK